MAILGMLGISNHTSAGQFCVSLLLSGVSGRLLEMVHFAWSRACG